MTKLTPDDSGKVAKREGRAGRAERQELGEPAQARPVPEDSPFERGCRVRVTSGPFAGKSGVVQELVGRRSARVILGRLPVQIDLDDLAPGASNTPGRSRPRLSSSHRKPVPARS